jgi:REP element-mobilizing transposase RayT
MTSYRRNFVPGGSFFFTVNLADRKPALLTEHIEGLREAFRETRRRHPFTIDAIVVLPDHIHTVWTMPEFDADFATRWRLIKSTFSRGLARGEPVRQAGPQSENEVSGSGAIGNTPSVTKAISRGTLTIFTSTLLSMAWSIACTNGRHRRFIDT